MWNASKNPYQEKGRYRCCGMLEVDGGEGELRFVTCKRISNRIIEELLQEYHNYIPCELGLLI